MERQMSIFDISPEIWKLIKGTSKSYVSNLGNVKRGNRIQKPHYDQEGYARVSVDTLGRKRVHELVAMMFVENPCNKPQIDHINDNKKDNRASNLQWVTSQENTKKAGSVGALSHHPAPKPIIGFHKNNGVVYAEKFTSQSDAERCTGVNAKLINKNLKDKLQTTKGWIFCYADNPTNGDVCWINNNVDLELDGYKRFLQGSW